MVYDVTLTDSGDVFRCGITDSEDFPAYNSSIGGDDAFVAKLSDDGGSLLFGMHYGSRAQDLALSMVAIDPEGVLFVGRTDSTELPLIDAYQDSFGGAADAFIARVSDDCCRGVRGNADGDFFDKVDVADVTYLTGYLFSGGWAPPCTDEGNVDDSCTFGSCITINDLSYLVAYLFQGGPPPPPCP